jgi:hypothetical protein
MDKQRIEAAIAKWEAYADGKGPFVSARETFTEIRAAIAPPPPEPSRGASTHPENCICSACIDRKYYERNGLKQLGQRGY